MQILLAFILCQLAREARFGNRNQIFNLKGIHTRGAVAAGGHDAGAIWAKGNCWYAIVGTTATL